MLPLKPDWTFFSPLIFSLNGTLISTENRGDEVEDITLIEGDEVLLSCAPNYFRDIPSQKSIRAICREDKLLCKYFMKIQLEFFLLFQRKAFFNSIEFKNAFLCCKYVTNLI